MEILPDSQTKAGQKQFYIFLVTNLARHSKALQNVVTQYTLASINLLETVAQIHTR